MPYSLALRSSVPQWPCPNQRAWALAEEEAQPGLQHCSSSMAYPGPGEGRALRQRRQLLLSPLALLCAQKAAQPQLQPFFSFISFPATLRGLVEMSHSLQNCQKEGIGGGGGELENERRKTRREKAKAGQNIPVLPASSLREPLLPTLSNVSTCQHHRQGDNRALCLPF